MSGVQVTTRRETAPVTAAGTALDRWGRALQRLPLHLVIVIFIAIWIVPTIGMIINSFRAVGDMGTAGWWTTLFPPHGFTFASYQQVLNTENVATSIVNSVLITLPATVIQLAIATMGAYAFAWMNFPGKNIFFIVIVGLMVVPIQMTLIPVLQFFRATGLNGTIVAVWLAHSGYGLPFEVFLLRNYLGGLPREIFESAEVDGAGHAVRFLRIAVPMTVPAIASLTIFVFLGVWNDLLVALTYLGTSPNRPFTVVITQLVTSLGGGWQFLTAAAVLQMALPLAVFIFLQRYFVRGITSGSVKG
ncbi:MAG: carbohydrate ABC transporter permease [Chloroflexi bacterium]|nr:MAG: carbohydrate ABC transporter permease [Chloroflexota bacterium]TMF80575.1 MAG: carbohydrate ABC transporter permease [Chloroflexota bacterium]TMF92190.1 MAG: carbohydrate ABC transporter permease [Chloroflexota bacterium]TMG46750.1 MAG: carbohydrate ABC transporter permease [Chloroflexota bacterium]